MAENQRKKDFIGKIKGMIHNTNFVVGSNEPSFERKEIATVENPNYEQVVVSPKPHKNITTMKLKYNEQQAAFAKAADHSKTMDINKVDFTVLSMNQRPKILSHLKQTSINFSNQHHDPLPFKKNMPLHHFRNNSYNLGFRYGSGPVYNTPTQH